MVGRRAWPRRSPARRGGMITLELVVAIGIISIAMLPLAYSLVHEQRLARAYYYRAVAMEIVDGEMEALLAGEWLSYPTGRQTYAVRARSATNLPPGTFTLTRTPSELRLEWRPRKVGRGGMVSRVAPVPVERAPSRP